MIVYRISSTEFLRFHGSSWDVISNKFYDTANYYTLLPNVLRSTMFRQHGDPILDHRYYEVE